MFFGLDAEKILLIGVIAAIIIGPERLPQAAAWLSRAVKQLKQWATGAKSRLKEEMGDDFDDVEWRKLDPRQYDPRRIIRNALLEEPEPRVQAPPVAPIAPHVPTDAVGAAPRVASDPIGSGSVRPSIGAPRPLPLDEADALDDAGFPPLPDAGTQATPPVALRPVAPSPAAPLSPVALSPVEPSPAALLSPVEPSPVTPPAVLSPAPSPAVSSSNGASAPASVPEQIADSA
ncbi:hypothetical protein [Microbacterium sp. No. 7]|uniref:hypothetical protein n=1 Tax=Microbacterium sp. No. 7 TaxID=1714373 RepID=UPI0006CF6A95